MKPLVTDIHHVTAIASDTQKNIDFYTGFLGLRLVKKTVNFDAPEVYHFYYGDEDGNKDKRPGYSNGNIPLQNSIKGFYNAEIWEEGYERTAGLLTEQMDHKLIAEKENRFRFAVTDSPGNYIDILCSPDSLKGLAGSGTVHHIAFATPDKETQLEVRMKIVKRMLNPTPVLDRNYFTSIYFREPGGVLFEVATSGPGFAIDESKEHLGEALKLPSQFEPRRKELENILPPITFNHGQYQ